MPKTLLFIPFADNNDDLQIKALSWRKADKKKGKEPSEVLCYGEKPYFDLHGIETVYILAHGYKDEADKIYNTDDPDDAPVYSIDIQTLVNRFISSIGTIDSLKKIKLYFCDETGKNATSRAVEFAALIKDAYPNISVDYYAAKISTPNNSDGSKKGELYFGTMFANNASTLLKVGKASEFRDTIILNPSF